MNYILVIIIAIIVAMISISQYSAFKVECRDKRIRDEFLVLSFCIALIAFLLIAMEITYGSKICFIMYAFDKFFKVITMGYIILLTQDLIGIDKKYTSFFVSLMSYGAVILFVIDSFFQGGELSKGTLGIYFAPRFTWLKLIYIIYYMLYDVVLLTFVTYKASIVFKKREKYELYLLFMTYAFSALGFSIESFIMFNGTFYIPFALFFNLISLIFLRKLLNYHFSIQISEDTFEKELDPSRLDVAFILDDEMNIIFQNKKAEILSQIFDDEYVGKKLSDVFKFSDSAYGQISSSPDEIPFGITADYEINKHHINMVIQHRIDRYKEILASVVYVYNMEDELKSISETKEKTEEGDLVTESILSITKDARALIIDEDIVFSNILTRLLKQYEVNVTRAFDGNEGIKNVRDNVYDIIFVALDMNKMSGVDTVKAIRGMDGEYHKQVPVCYLMQSDINDVLDKIIDTRFNDYLSKPVNARNLSLVLTRWLWQRFGNTSVSSAKAEITIDSRLLELSSLMESSRVMFEKRNYTNLLYVAKAVFKCSIKIGHIDMAKISMNLSKAIILEDTPEITRLYLLMQDGINKIVTI